MPKEQPVSPTLKPMETVSPAIIPPVDPGRAFSPMLQGTGTNALTRTSTRRTPPEIDEITGLAKISTGSLTVFIEQYNALSSGLRISTHKLLDMLTIALTEQNDYRGKGELHTLVSLPLVDYMDKCGIPQTKTSKDKARRKVREDLETLYNISIEWSENTGRGGDVKEFAKTRICDMIAIRNGNIMMNFSKSITDYLTNAYIMQYPVSLFRTDERNPNSFYLGKKLLQHNSIQNNQKKGTANIISVRKLLENTPDIPTYDEVMQKDRHLDQRIIQPFQNGLDALSNIISWEYTNRKGEPLSEEQLEHFNYGVFIDCFVKFEVGQG